METTDIVIAAEPPRQLQRSILDLPHRQMIAQVVDMADCLSDIIEKQKMYIVFNGKKYVTVDGWCTLGTMLGVLPAEKEVHEIENGWFAKVDLINKNTGVVVGSASAICTRGEKSWKEKPDFSVRSMAITRATGKAFRLSFSWIMNMAGYQSTPAEEMPIEDTTIHRSDATAPAKQKETKIIFDMANQAHMDKLDSVLTKKKIPTKDHLLVAEKLDSQEFNKENVDKIIEEIKSIPVEIPF